MTPLTASTQPGASTTSGQAEAPETDDLHVIGLIPHLNLDAARLQQILQGSSQLTLSLFVINVLLNFKARFILNEPA